MIPSSFSERFCTIVGSEDRTFVDSVLQSVKKSLRINTAKISIPNFKKLAKKKGWKLTPIPWEPAGFFIDREDMTLPLGKTIEHFAGLFYIQEASSMLPARVLSPSPKHWVLDMAAAPGSKTTQLSNLMGNEGIILSNDASVIRIKALASNIERQGCINVALVSMNAKKAGDIMPNTFDRILLDAPCSGEGTAFKDHSYFKRWSVDMIGKTAGLQKSLIMSAFKALRVGGRLVYSTCTFAPEENEMVIDFLLKRYGGRIKLVDFSVEGALSDGLSAWKKDAFDPSIRCTKRSFPHKTGTGGFFVALMEKTDTDHVMKQKHEFVTQEKFFHYKAAKQYTAFLRKTYGISESLFDPYILTQMGDGVWMKPYSYTALSKYVRMDRCGVRLLTINHDNSLKLSTVGAWAIGHHAMQNCITLEEEQMRVFLSGRDVALSDIQLHSITTSYPIIKESSGLVLGVSLVQDHRLKNQLPRHFVMNM